jgi:pullulanase/glycogen debranching enzyme
MSKNLEIWRGEPYPLGATLTDEGVNFALYAENAIAVELCLFDSPEPTATELRIPVTDQTDQTWHVLLPETGAGSSTDIAYTVCTNRRVVCVSSPVSLCLIRMPKH